MARGPVLPVWSGHFGFSSYIACFQLPSVSHYIIFIFIAQALTIFFFSKKARHSKKFTFSFCFVSFFKSLALSLHIWDFYLTMHLQKFTLCLHYHLFCFFSLLFPVRSLFSSSSSFLLLFFFSKLWFWFWVMVRFSRSGFNHFV